MEPALHSPIPRHPSCPAGQHALPTRSSGGRAQSASSAISARNRGSAGGGSIVSTFTHVPGLEATGGEDSRDLESWSRAAGCNLRPWTEILYTPNSDTFSHLASRSSSRSHSWHCLARRSQSLTCSTPMSKRPGGFRRLSQESDSYSIPWFLHPEGPKACSICRWDLFSQVMLGKSCSSSPKVTSALGHPGCAAVPAQGVGQSPVYRYCSRAPKATGLICRQSRKERSEATTQHELTALPEAGTLSQGRRDAPAGAGEPQRSCPSTWCPACWRSRHCEHRGYSDGPGTAFRVPQRPHRCGCPVPEDWEKPEGLHHPGNCWFTKTTQHTHPP